MIRKELFLTRFRSHKRWVQEPCVIKNVGDYKEKKEYQSYHKYNHKNCFKNPSWNHKYMKGVQYLDKIYLREAKSVGVIYYLI